MPNVWVDQRLSLRAGFMVLLCIHSDGNGLFCIIPGYCGFHSQFQFNLTSNDIKVEKVTASEKRMKIARGQKYR